MARNRGDDADETVMFESVGIGPSGGEPVEFVPVDVVPEPPADRRRPGQKWAVAAGVGVVVLFAAVVWVTTRPATPDAVEDWQVRLPTDPTEAFVWRVPGDDEPEVWAAGTADHPYVMTVGPESGTIYALDGSGDERWQASIGGGSYAEAYPHEGTVVTVTQGPDRYAESTDDPAQVIVTAVATDDGHRVWQTSATGDFSTAIDGHIVVFDFPDDALLDGENPSDLPVTTITSIDMTSGERGPTKRYDQVISDWVGNELLVKLDGKVVRLDGALNPVGTAVPTGDAAAGSDGERILTLGEGEVTVYDTEGAVIRSASKLPDELAGDAYWSVGGFGGFGSDVWIFVTSSNGPDCGAFRYGAGDDTPVVLWRSDDCFIYAPPGISRPETADVARYALRWSTTDGGGTELIDIETGSVVAEGDSIALATNGYAVYDGEQLVGHTLEGDSPGDSLFTIADAAEDWQPLADAVVIAHRPSNSDVDYVTFYRDGTDKRS